MLNGVYDTLSQILKLVLLSTIVYAISCVSAIVYRKSMEKQGVNEHMDALLLLLDEVVDGGYVTCTVYRNSAIRIISIKKFFHFISVK